MAENGGLHMPNRTLVPDKLQGYLLQVRHMLYELISVDDRIVSIEKLDDVAVEADGKVIAEQVKSVTSANNPIAERLTVRVKNQSGRNDYLWEIGSASNWLSYHIALILALHRFFQTKSSVNIPNFIVFDQPSQVYFPRTRYSLDEAELQLNDDDKNAVRKIFESLSVFVKDAGFEIQIIVTEHADDDIWGNIPDSRIHLVEKWRNNIKLVPVEWLA